MAASHASANTNVVAPITGITILLGFMFDYSMIEAFWFESAINMMKPSCVDPSLLTLNNPSEYTITSSESFSRYLFFSLNFGYFLICLISVRFILISSC